VKSKNIKVSEDCHARLKNYLYHQQTSWNGINELGDVVEEILNEWEVNEKKKSMSASSSTTTTPSSSSTPIRRRAKYWERRLKVNDYTKKNDDDNMFLFQLWSDNDDDYDGG
jgi:hypothetical protein